MTTAISNPAEAPERTDAENTTAEKPARQKLVKFLADGAERLATPEVPEGFNSSKHLPLAKSDFVDEVTFLLFKAGECERKAAKYRREAETVQKLGNATDRSKAKKLLTLQSKMAELAKELAKDETINLREVLGEETYALLLGAQPPQGAQSPAE